LYLSPTAKNVSGPAAQLPITGRQFVRSFSAVPPLKPQSFPILAFPEGSSGLLWITIFFMWGD
jgi:hypothetical protein